MSRPILTRGATRSDGYRFWAYEKRNGRLREKWRNPESYERLVVLTRRLRSKWKPK